MAENEFSGADWLDANWERMRARGELNHQWVAVGKEGIVANDPQIDRVIYSLREQDIDLDDVTFAYINFDIRVRS